MTVFDSTVWQKVTNRVQGDLYIFPTGDDFYDTTDIEEILEEKRLTDTELSAEYWRLKADLCTVARITDSPIEIDRKAEIMYRFATHDHAFEGAQP